MQPVSEVAGVVLCGGKSSRMGTDKALLKLGKKTLLELSAERLSLICETVVLGTNVSHKYTDVGYTALVDRMSDAGPLASLYTALSELPQPYVFMIACDMPFLNLELAQEMVNLRSKAAIVVPQIGDYYQPTCALYSKSCLPLVQEMLANNERRMFALFEKIKPLILSESEVKRFDPSLISFLNINTPEEYQRAQAIYERQMV